MEHITRTINNLTLEAYTSILALWAAVTLYAIKALGKFLGWCGSKIAQGAIKDLLSKLMPQVKSYLDDKIGHLEVKIDTEIGIIKDSIKSYKKEKHRLEGENISLKQVILSRDGELLENVREALEDEKKN